MRVGIIGYGGVAAVHAAQLNLLEGVQLSVVCGPDLHKAERFAAAHRVASATADLKEAASRMDAAIVCSPSGEHFAQTLSLLDAGKRVLVELPACESGAEAVRIAQMGAEVSCAHTSRYLQPYRKLGEWIDEGTLGAIRHVHFIRHIPPRNRSWTDDALIHHAAHILDLMLHWFGSVTPVACVATPEAVGAQDVALIAIAGMATQVALQVSYTSHLAQLGMTVAGEQHTVLTDGFSFIRSDATSLQSEWDGNAEYARAIGEQDREFLAGRGTPWAQTVRLAQLTDEFRGVGIKQ